jgi:hypothetical protein
LRRVCDDFHGEIIDDIDGLDRAAKCGRSGCGRVWRHLPLQAELYVVRCQWIAIVELLAGAQIKGPGQAVLGHLPGLGNARAGATFSMSNPTNESYIGA